MPNLPFPIPTGFPFDICAPTPDGTQVCVQTGSVVDNFGQPRDCNGGETPPLVSVDATFQEKTIEFFGDSEVVFENTIWAGVETDLGAFWVGESISEQCYRYDLDGLDPAATASEVIDEARDQARDATRDVFNVNPDSVLGSIIVAGLLVLLILLIDGFPIPY
jgi:hypothetical protein